MHEIASMKRIRVRQPLSILLFSCFLLALIIQSPVLADSAGYTHPQAVLSISGSLGDNGWYTSDVEASLYVTGGSDSDSLVTQYALYNQAWTTYEEPFTIFEEGQTTIYYRVRNEATDYVGETKFSMIDIDKTPPTGSITIDGGNKDAFSTTITLTFSVTDEPSGPTTNPPSGYIWGVPSGPSDIRFSNDGHLWSLWMPIEVEKSWVLEAGGGTKTVFAQARDNAGLVSEVFSDDIIVITSQDNTAPTTKITVSGRQLSQDTYASPVMVTLNSADDLSGVALTEYSFDNQTWVKYSNSLPIDTEGTIVIFFRSHDSAGNMEAITNQTIKIESEKQIEMDPTILYVVLFISPISVLMAFLVKKRYRKR